MNSAGASPLTLPPPSASGPSLSPRRGKQSRAPTHLSLGRGRNREAIPGEGAAPAPPVTHDQAPLPHLPVFLTVRGRLCVLVGGSDAAVPKFELLRRAGAAVRLVGADPAFAETAAGAEILPGPLTAAHLAGACLVIDASGEPDTNARSATLARAAGVPLNVVDRPALCDFILPAILDRSPVVVAVSTGGAAPALAGLIRQELEALIPPGLGRLAALSGMLRDEIRRITDPSRRLAFWRRLYRDGAADRVAALDLLDQVAAERPSAGALTRITIGPGGEQDLTLRQVAALRRADLLLVEDGVDPAVLDHARRDAPRRGLVRTPAEAAALRHELDRGLQVVQLVAEDSQSLVPRLAAE
ncbi:bifunctional precorrin-2 dehydrogenase/sirohydrochlorin ferrochelatase [Mycobacterium sp. KBS0706]|uniref:precorrin-2 dehydrogenase/sirohydrochlorin ferrochelatase family protein n=1 Tax=Mycobacterium sp. KBS0706 TaxID=2578109 RepID=UPI0027D2AEF4|nr:NAD(P)-dependent oxidoreductase [Mycobacterium sp. KBS0706]